MALFRRKLGPIERFESALKGKQAERQKLAARLSLAESLVTEKRAAAEQLAKAGAGNAKLARAEAMLRSVEDRANALRAALGEANEQVFATERALADAVAQRDRELLADRIEALAAAIDQAVPGFTAGAAGLVDAVAKAAVTVAEASGFSTNVGQVSREVLAAADLVCWELRTLAARTRVGNANAALLPSPGAASSQLPEIERQLIYTLSPLKWQDGTEMRKATAFALVELPKTLLPIALQHQHVDYLSARRVKTLIQVHGSGGIDGDDPPDDSEFIDLNALAARTESETIPRADVA
ncbi:hypothetical protein [Bradyrhizobium sp.]|uniref:hypothetical protein n=1 Tax=Bradyrhizobium sp. TaxID=376 RepID=UPI00238A4A83|nr:hypothetical protein [Bradyrhizobium sp.]MDE2380054.1 hypothetical protein [Bradyrhizobium sp.]